MTKEKRNSKKKEQKLTSQELQKAILKLFQNNPGKKYSTRLIIEKLGVANNKDSVDYALDQLAVSGHYKVVSSAPAKSEESQNLDAPRELATPSVFGDKPRTHRTSPRSRDTSRGSSPQRGIHEGTVDITKTGAGYIICAGMEQDIYVPQKFLMGAMKGDTVKVSAYFPSGGRRRPDGEVVKILKRASDHFIGIYSATRKVGIVTPDRIDVPWIYVLPEDAKDAEEGQKVVVKVTEWDDTRGRKLYGKITSVLGYAGSSDIEMKAILINNGFNIEFSEEVLAETERINDDTPHVPAHTEGDGVKVRRDFRGITTFTIDPFDAKDFDDALSYRLLKSGNIEIGVHIADVTHYVLPKTALDHEAYMRSTSVYLVDRVCPMLPERLSNELCSLRPHEDKLTFSAVFEFDDKFSLKKKWFGKTIIHSNRRYAYEEAQEILEAGTGDFADELIKLNQIAYYLRKKRFKNGAINFETDEVKFRLDAEGVPIEVFIKERKDAHLLIEDFMLLANKEVATFMAKRGGSPSGEGAEVPFVYRTHDEPDLEKLKDFAAFARELGVKMNLDTPKKIAQSLNDLAEKSEKDETLRLLTPIAIRCMAKAEYTTENIGHYGLAFDFYSHFTSPIRRYSDVLAHRVLFENLKTIKRYDKAKLEDECKHISKQERKAADAERQSVKYKQVEYIHKHIGEVFEGVVSGMIERGFFVEIKHMLTEGMVDFGRCPEPFEVEPSRLRARGTRSGKYLKMGHPVKVQIVDANLEMRQIEMRLIEF